MVKKMKNNKMDRGTDTLKKTLRNVSEMSIRQTRKGWFQECLGCEAKTEFKYFVKGRQVGDSLQDAGFCCRFWCTPIYPFSTKVKSRKSEKELITVDRPFRLPFSACKCCCYQEATVSSGGKLLGSVKEDCYYFVPSMTVSSHKNGQPVYKVHPPTCCCGMCVNCFAEGACSFCCCIFPFHVFPANQQETGADYAGKIVKVPKSLATEVFTDANAFDVEFPDKATPQQKGLLMGTALFLNANFFENAND